jgi:hypothetical protein
MLQGSQPSKAGRWYEFSAERQQLHEALMVAGRNRFRN